MWRSCGRRDVHPSMVQSENKLRAGPTRWQFGWRRYSMKADPWSDEIGESRLESHVTMTIISRILDQRQPKKIAHGSWHTYAICHFFEIWKNHYIVDQAGLVIAQINHFERWNMVKRTQNSLPVLDQGKAIGAAAPLLSKVHLTDYPLEKTAS